MRALTIHEPYAGLLAAGIKTIEVRKQPFQYRGQLLIHAAKEGDRPGAVIGIVELVDCRPLTAADLAAAVLQEMPAREVYGLVLGDAQRLPCEVEWRGRQGLWIPEPKLREVVAEVLGPWGSAAAAAARAAGLWLSWRDGRWVVCPADPAEAKLRHVITSLPGRVVKVYGSEEASRRAYREFQKIKRGEIAAMGRIYKKDVAEAARAVGLRLLLNRKHGEWELVDGTGKPVRAGRSLAALLQHCRDQETAQETAPVVVDAPPAATTQVSGAEAAVEALAAAAGAAEADRLYGDGQPYNEEELVHRAIRHRSAMEQLAAGAVHEGLQLGACLIRLKEHQQHGTWMPLLERIGVNQKRAERVMRAAHKFLGNPNSTLVTNLDSITKAYELAVVDDDDLAELREGGSIAGVTLDDIQRMSPSELRETLRRDRRERREREDAQRERIQKKDARIEQLESEADDLRRILDAARHPGRKSWTDAEWDLLTESARADLELHQAVDNFEAVIERLHGRAAEEDGRSQSSLRLHNVPGAAALLDVRGRLEATASFLHGKLSEIDERLSDHLATERELPADMAPWEVPTPPPGEADGAGPANPDLDPDSDNA